MNYFNYHTHTLYCDGKEGPESFIQEAIRKEMKAIGFSSHSPLPFDNGYSIKSNQLDVYQKQIRDLQTKYKDTIAVFLALEFDYIPGISSDFSILKNSMNLDYTIGSVHLVKEERSGLLWFIDGGRANYEEGINKLFNGAVEKAVEAYYLQVQEMIISQQPDIIGHIDKVKMYNKNQFFSEQDKWYKKLVKDTLTIVSKSKSIIEVNTRGIYKKKCDSLYPGIEILKEIYKMDIPITISSDAHSPQELTSLFPETIAVLKDIGFKKIKYFTTQAWKDCLI